jgi:hypothetical protein
MSTLSVQEPTKTYRAGDLAIAAVRHVDLDTGRR